MWWRWLAVSVVVVQALLSELSLAVPQSVFFFSFFFFFFFSFLYHFYPSFYFFLFFFVLFFSLSFFFSLGSFFNINTYKDIQTRAYTGKVHTSKNTDKDYTETCIQGLHRNKHTRADMHTVTYT